MGLIFWWLLLGWIGAIVAYWLIRGQWLKRRHSRPIAVPVAHTERLTSLSVYRVALLRYRRLLGLTTIFMSAALLGGVLLSARPATTALITPAQSNRDIMLCLDVSGSVLREDARLIDSFRTLVNSFSGQRIGLTLFNSSAVNVMPLNDDYQLIDSQLTTDSAAFKAQKGPTFTELTDGTLADFDQGTSLVSDGFASCINHLGDNPLHRSQSIILATDNEANGTPIVTMTQAAALAQKQNIRMYAIDPGASEPGRAADHAQLKAVALQTGGNYYQLSDNGSIAAIVADISSQESKYFGGTPQLATADSPKPFLYAIALLTLASLGLAWRLQL